MKFQSERTTKPTAVYEIKITTKEGVKAEGRKEVGHDFLLIKHTNKSAHNAHLSSSIPPPPPVVDNASAPVTSFSVEDVRLLSICHTAAASG